MRKTLLSVGTNLTLLGIRNMVFVRAGYEVIPAKTGASALRAINGREVDAVVIGHSVSERLRDRIAQAAKKQGLPVIALQVIPNCRPAPFVDATLCGLDGAAKITEVLKELIA